MLIQICLFLASSSVGSYSPNESDFDVDHDTASVGDNNGNKSFRDENKEGDADTDTEAFRNENPFHNSYGNQVSDSKSNSHNEKIIDENQVPSTFRAWGSKGAKKEPVVDLKKENADKEWNSHQSDDSSNDTFNVLHHSDNVEES